MAYKARFDENRGFGVEIECFGVSRKELQGRLIGHGFITVLEEQKSQKVIPLWTLNVDNTIKGEDSVEVISPILNGWWGLEKTRCMIASLESIGCQVNDSCGFHVHWDASDFTGDNLLSLLKLYTKFEWTIDGLVDAHRRYNICRYAQTLLKEADLDWIDQLGENKLAVTIASNFQEFYSLDNTDTIPSARHHKVNICSLLKHGTVEFRQHHGTLCWQEAVDWIVLTQLIVNKARETKVNNLVHSCTLSTLLRSLRVRSVSIDLANRLKERYRCQKN